MNKNYLIKTRDSQKGTILIVALFVMTLIEIVLMGIVESHRIAMRQSNNFIASSESMNRALGGEDWAKARILQSIINNENMIADALPMTSLEGGGTLEATVRDAQGQYNLNNLTNANNIPNFIHLLASLVPNRNGFDSKVVAKILKEKFSLSTPIINLLNPEGQTFPFNSVTELLNIPEITTEIFLKLLPHVTVLPNVTKLNINSATNYSLLALSPDITIETANSIIKIRDNMKGFSSINTLLNLVHSPDLQASANQLTIQSQYFICSVTVRYKNIDLTLNSLLKVVKDNNNKPNIFVEWRSFGTL